MINKKRLELEDFIREQTLGPGAMASRFIDLRGQHDDTANTIFLPHYRAELINMAPASIYSTGILFPVDETKAETIEEEEEDGANSENHKVNEKVPLVNGSEQGDAGEEEDSNVDAQSLNQMFPNSIGLTVCLNPAVAKDNDLEITITARYYRKLDLKHPEVSVGVILEQDRFLFEAFLAQLPADDLIRSNTLIGSTREGINYIYLSGDSPSSQAMKIRLYQIKNEQTEILSKSEGQSYKAMDKFKEKLFNDLRFRVPPHTEPGQKIVAQLKKIETIENSISHLLDLVSIYDSAGYGIWACEYFEHRVAGNLPIPVGFKGKQIYTYKKEKALANIHLVEYAKDKRASMAVNIQYSKHDRLIRSGDALYLKVQLVNTSTPFSKNDTKNGKNYFSMASEEVNKRCFFGVGIRVKSRNLIPYRMHKSEEKPRYSEEEVNQYIYRQFKDYGLGHGCSVRWGEEERVCFVCTEYIPMHETPDVDPIPRYKKPPMQKEGDRYSPRPVFSDTRFLQFKWLSTLSKATDAVLLVGLKEFVEAYEKWIDEQQDKEQPGIATQIRKLCQQDQARMLSNIDLLDNSKDNMFCFRAMNTAMFMQLWHSEKAKKDVVDDVIKSKEFNGFFEDFLSSRSG